MTVLVVALAVTAVVVAVAAVAGAALVAMRSASTVLGMRRRRRVIVTLKTDAAFAGVLYVTDREALVLREAQALAYGAKKDNVIVEGELVVLRADVAYLQVLPSGTAVAS